MSDQERDHLLPEQPQLERDVARYREAMLENPRYTMALRLLEELFLANCKRVRDEYISPLNVEAAGQELEMQDMMRKQKEKELYDSLVQVYDSLKVKGGISESIYRAHKYAINSLARDLVGQRSSCSELPNFCEIEDRKGKMATPEQIARFPEDGDFRGINSANIVDGPQGFYSFEGTLFQAEFDDQGNLQLYRIFHQGHRNSLAVRSVPIERLMERIKGFVSSFTEKIPTQDFGLTLDRAAYLDKVAEFNSHFGHLVRLCLDSDHQVFAQFMLNPEKLAKKLVELSEVNGGQLQCKKTAISYEVCELEPRYNYVDLFLPEQMTERIRFDSKIYADRPTVILPYVDPEFSISLMAMYVAADF